MGLFWKSKKERQREEKQKELQEELQRSLDARRKLDGAERKREKAIVKKEMESKEMENKKVLREGEVVCRVEMVVGKEGDGNLCAVNVRSGFEMAAALQLADIVLRLTKDASGEKMKGLKRLGGKLQSVQEIAEHLSKMDEDQLKDALRLIENVKKGV